MSSRRVGAILVAIVAVAVTFARPLFAGPLDGCGPVRAEKKAISASVPNDPLYAKQWNLQQIHAPQAWEAGARGRGTTIALIDSGVDTAHADLRSKLVLAPGLQCSEVLDEIGHGTHTAGIAAASTNNGIGIAGVAPAAKIMPIPWSDDIASDVRTAVNSGADVINMSLITSYAPIDPTQPEFAEAIASARSKGVVVVAAAGNLALPLCSYPAAHPLVLCVSSTDRRELPVYSSQLPLKEGMLALRAPGGMNVGGCDSQEDIWSTLLPGSPYESCSETPGYGPLGGTSMAAPHVSGVAALLSGEGLDADAIVDCIITTARNPLTGQRGVYDPVYGYGIVDAAAAVKTCQPRDSGQDQ